jgi:hypothetical protein
MSWVRIFVFLGVNGGVVHGRGFESLTFGVSGGVVHVVGSNLCLFRGQWRRSAVVYNATMHYTTIPSKSQRFEL